MRGALRRSSVSGAGHVSHVRSAMSGARAVRTFADGFLARRTAGCRVFARLAAVGLTRGRLAAAGRVRAFGSFRHDILLTRLACNADCRPLLGYTKHATAKRGATRRHGERGCASRTTRRATIGQRVRKNAVAQASASGTAGNGHPAESSAVLTYGIGVARIMTQGRLRVIGAYAEPLAGCAP